MSNYSKEETKWMIAEYQKEPNRDTVDRLSSTLNKSMKSVIGKLSREGVYRRENYITKTGEKPITKLEMITELADHLNLKIEKLEGLEKTPKPALKYLLAEIERVAALRSTEKGSFDGA